MSWRASVEEAQNKQTKKTHVLPSWHWKLLNSTLPHPETDILDSRSCPTQQTTQLTTQLSQPNEPNQTKTDANHPTNPPHPPARRASSASALPRWCRSGWATPRDRFGRCSTWLERCSPRWSSSMRLSHGFWCLGISVWCVGCGLVGFGVLFVGLFRWLVWLLIDLSS